MAANSAVSTHPLAKNLGFQGRFGMSHREALESVTAEAAQARAHMQLQPESDKSSTKEPPITQSESSVLSPSTVIQEKTPFMQHKDRGEETNEKKSSNHTSESSPKKKVDKQDVKQDQPPNHSDERADGIPRTPKSDGYSWRKYGQKQVKGSGSSRSYYRCTYFHCCAKKKVQHLDVSGRIIEVVYKGDHNHDPPQNIRGSSQKRDAPSAAPVMPNDTSDPLVQKLDDRHTPTCGRELNQEVVPLTPKNQDNNPNTSASTSQGDAGELHMSIPDPTPRLKNEAAMFPAESEHCRSSDCDELAMTDPMKDRDLAPLKKRRIKETATGKASSDTVYRTFKEPKIVVHAAGDVGTSNDGYRWRKYGQKMVKGSPHPRSYYRCSSSGCPVRKHVERATDNSTAIIVTYEGKHDHDMPVPKKHCGSPKSSPPASALLTANKPPSRESETKSLSSSQGPPAKQSRDVDSDLSGDKAAEAGSDKVLESARTLLSIGIELKSC